MVQQIRDLGSSACSRLDRNRISVSDMVQQHLKESKSKKRNTLKDAEKEEQKETKKQTTYKEIMLMLEHVWLDYCELLILNVCFYLCHFMSVCT